MFSPYGIGPLPPSAMAEIEKKAAGLQSSSLRRLLDMDKKHKVRGAHRPPAPLLPWLLVGCLLAWLPVLCLLVVSLRDMSNTTSSYFCRRSNYKAPQCLLRRHRRRLRRRTALSRSVAPNLSHSSRTT